MRNSNGWRSLWILLLAPVFVMVLTAAKCATGTDEGDEDAPTVSVVVKLHNLDTPVIGDNIHILSPGEEFSPSNRLAPGESRDVTISMRHDQGIEFRAGRNGTVLPGGASKRCTCSVACPSSPGGLVGSPSVEWNGTTLSCVGW